MTDTILVTENKMMRKRDSPYPQEAQTLEKKKTPLFIQSADTVKLYEWELISELKSS